MSELNFTPTDNPIEDNRTFFPTNELTSIEEPIEDNRTDAEKALDKKAWEKAFDKYPLLSETEITLQRRDAFVEGYKQAYEECRAKVTDWINNNQVLVRRKR